MGREVIKKQRLKNYFIKFYNMNMKSKQTITIILLATAIVTSFAWFKNRNKKIVDDYDWIMW